MNRFGYYVRSMKSPDVTMAFVFCETSTPPRVGQVIPFYGERVFVYSLDFGGPSDES